MAGISINYFKKRVSKVHQQGNKAVKWNDATIPARIFFEMMHSADYSVLGSTPEENAKAFMQIFDEYVDLDGNDRIVSLYRKKCRIVSLESRINAINMHLYAVLYTALNVDDRLKIIDSLNSIESSPGKSLVKFNVDKPLTEEVSRVQQFVIGNINNELNIERLTEKKQSEAVKYSFESDLVAIEDALGRTIPDDITLKKYIAYKKSAQEKAKQRKLSNGRTKK